MPQIYQVVYDPILRIEFNINTPEELDKFQMTQRRDGNVLHISKF